MGRWMDEPEEGGWPLFTASDIVNWIEAAHLLRERHEARIADLKRERALLLRYVRTAEYITPIFDDDDDAEVMADFLAARRALIDAGLLDAGLLEGDDTETSRQEAGE